MQKISNLSSSSTVFRAYEGEEVDKIKNNLVMCTESFRRANCPHKPKTIYIPYPVLETLEKHSVGSVSNVMVGITEYFLDELKRREKTLILKKKENLKPYD